jgi:tetratricopeptide (TPR) repeat protein
MMFDQALHAMQNRKLAEAEVICRKILADAPKDFDALHMLAVICSEKGEYEESEKLFRATISLDPYFPPGYYNYGSLLAKQKKYLAAITQFDKALSIFPNFAPAHCDRGLALKELGRFDEALGSLTEAVSLAPNVPMVWYNRGNVYSQKHDYSSALSDYDRAIKIDPHYADAWLGHGNAFAGLKRYDEAFAAYDRALALKPDLVKVWLARGNVLYDLKRHDEALVAYDKALGLKSDLAEAWLGRGSACYDLKRYDEALAACNNALAHKPDWNAWLARAGVLYGLNRYDEALVAFDNAIALKPDLAEAWLGRGNIFKNLSRYNEAFVAYDKAHALKPDLAEAQCNEALIRLVLGDTECGWKKFEYRWDTKLMRGWKRNFPQRLWLGDSDIKNKTILIHAEQGLGDTIMACRYVRMLASLGAKVIVEVQTPLKSLLKTLEGVSMLIGKGETIPRFDVQCPTMSLPLAFKTTIETIPAKVPYLAVSKDIIEKWRSKLTGAEIKVGIAWAGNPNHPSDLDRSIPLKSILPIVGVEGARYFSLQKDLRDGDKEILDVTSEIVQLDQAMNDFEDTAAIMMSLDLVISCDTSIVHVAGALSRPIWVLLPFSPDWRWLLDRNDSPWYPTARMFRQKSIGEWSTVTNDVCVELEKLVTEKKADKASYSQGQTNKRRPIPAAHQSKTTKHLVLACPLLAQSGHPSGV